MTSKFADSDWLRPPRTRNGQPTLSREQILRAAMEILDAEGPGGLSMRRLGTKLGSGATSLYWHVANKDELLELAVDEVIGEIYVPEPGDTSWRIGVSVWANGMRSALLRHPWVIGLLGTHPTLGPNAMRMGERIVLLLSGAGFAGMPLSHASAVINAHAIGAATTEAAAHAAIKRGGLDMAGVAEQMKPYVEKMADEHPAYDKWRREAGVAVQDQQQLLDEGFAFGLERLLDGLELWLAKG
ncbi:TetR/AcrR family transcriptional regulator [Paractinoplanes atraurantiacus]|uniref:Regulatory protein, tetR family n=1 Tax=Paractinoplanes atraurantiacus TaxID=1036182 RepID=A0A285F5M3_9ACTN|nr:TetR/AcrR family transcriptional regulator C-terminal domain-containing protein [Actinoplanes atraurantiacus]SNY06363.1 regulatory protein, tetR family [Actinoplanes atraurantiacus]